MNANKDLVVTPPYQVTDIEALAKAFSDFEK